MFQKSVGLPDVHAGYGFAIGKPYDGNLPNFLFECLNV